MSPGLGKIQQHILDRLGVQGCAGSYELARSLRDAEPTRSERASVQRAIRNLEQRGLVVVERTYKGLSVRLRD